MKTYTKLFFTGLPFFAGAGIASDQLMSGLCVGLAAIGVVFVIATIVKYCEVHG